MHSVQRLSVLPSAGLFAAAALLATPSCGDSGESGDGGGATGSKPCIDSTDCSDGERCNTGIPEPVCQPIYSIPEGEACGPGLCESGLNCLPDDTCNENPLDNYCAAPAPGGSYCCYETSCLSGVCDKIQHVCED